MNKTANYNKFKLIGASNKQKIGAKKFHFLELKIKDLNLHNFWCLNKLKQTKNMFINTLIRIPL